MIVEDNEEESSLLELFDSTVGTSEWLDILSWSRLPDFGVCQEYAAAKEYKKFFDRYLVTDELRSLSGTIALKFETDRASESGVLLKGSPGCGKTTFLYCLLAYANNNEHIGKHYTFYIAHANRFQDEDWEYEIVYAMKKALKQHFFGCDQKKHFDNLCSNENDDLRGLNRQVQKLKSCIVSKAHRDKFQKKLVFILDNADSIDNHERVISAFRLVQSKLEPGVIKKWFSVRPETIELYDQRLTSQLFSFISEQYTLPTCSFHEIVKHRIQNTTESKTAKDPFGKALCDDIIQPICGGNHRNSFTVLNGLLRNIPVKGFAGKLSTSEKVIQTYFANGVAKYMISERLLINLHDIQYSIKTLLTPLIYDLFALCRFSPSERTLHAMLYDAVERRNITTKYLITGRESKFTIQAQEVKTGLTILSKLGLINWNQNEGVVKVTAKGNATMRISSQDNYIKSCRDSLGDDRPTAYWTAAEVIISHETIAKKYSTTGIV